MKLKKILVTTDFSDLSRQAFPAAAGLARKFGAELHLVHVLESLPPLLFFDSSGVQAYSPSLDYRQKFKDLLTGLAGEEPSFKGLAVKTHLLEGGHFHERVTHFQKQQGIDLCVVATHGRSGLGHAFLGSFAEKVVRFAESPVLTFRPPAEAGKEGFAPRRLLVPYDFSPNAGSLLDLVRLFAETFEAEVIFQIVLDPRVELTVLPWEAGMAEQIHERWVDAPARAQKVLEAFARKELPRLARVEAVAEIGSPFLEIIRTARERKVDLILMSTHGRTGLKRMLLGSVAESVVRHAPCPVLTQRPRGLTFEQP